MNEENTTDTNFENENNMGFENDINTQNNEINNDANFIEEDENIVILKDENGNDVSFEFLDYIDYNGENYVILLPAEEVENEEAGEVVILKEDKTAESEEEESYVSVEDEEILNKVFELFKEKFKDEFDFEED